MTLIYIDWINDVLSLRHVFEVPKMLSSWELLFSSSSHGLIPFRHINEFLWNSLRYVIMFQIIYEMSCSFKTNSNSFQYLISLCKNITELSGPAPIFTSDESQSLSSSPVHSTKNLVQYTLGRYGYVIIRISYKVLNYMYCLGRNSMYSWEVYNLFFLIYKCYGEYLVGSILKLTGDYS